jgi:hypothetical protein
VELPRRKRRDQSGRLKITGGGRSKVTNRCGAHRMVTDDRDV